ncbi:MAG: hypothetical protein P1V51_17215 [Deltaproteobacteria bacterium]|nr:hypothetical protein [Deltaproteobacteria bacterium]
MVRLRHSLNGWSLALVLLLLAPEAASACLLVAPGRAPTLEGIRVTARRQSFLVGGREVPGWDARMLLAYDVVPEGQTIGIVFPVDEGVGVEVESQEGAEIASTLDWIAQVTEPVIHQTRDTSCQGCDVLDPVLPPPPIEDVVWRTGWDAGGYRIDATRSVAGLEAWLEANAFVLPLATEEALLLALAEGRQVVLITATPERGPAALQPIRIRAPGPLDLPLSLASSCGDRTLEITLLAGAPEPATVEGWDVIYLDEIDRELFRDLPGLPGVYDRLTSDHRGELFVVEGVLDLEGEELIDLSWDPLVDELLGSVGWLTRLRARVNAADLEHDVELVLDPDGHPLSNQLDLRPDPEAHGASISGEWLFVALALGLRFARRRR